ncbi:MAG: hypothetical protein Ta2B_27820 [Termitinemataceae bacterium]|nr:MAG: hypothetical protein Ta2B_27820 [Termitinemataceae bacterium]
MKPHFLKPTLLVVALFCSVSLFAQANSAAASDPISYIGLTINDLITQFGVPTSVYSVRGMEDWQDDVVFEYKTIDFYIFRNVVWQVSVKAALGINVGDPRAAVLLVMGNKAEDKSSYILQTVTGMSWTLQWRFNIKGGKVSSIYLYRMDY